jgi:hypothetical protein
MMLEWIESGGGPLILASKAMAEEWRGTDGSAGSNEMTDYQRACAVHDEIDVIPLGAGQVIVLGDEPDRTALFRRGGDVFIVRWRWADSEESLLVSLYDDLEQLEFPRSGDFSTIGGEHILFDSACPLSDVSESLHVDLDGGVFSLGTNVFAPRKDVCAVIHRLRSHDHIAEQGRAAG